MKLIDDWRELWKYLWSVRLALLAAGLTAAEAAVPRISDSVPPGLFLILSAIVSIAAAGSRLVAQNLPQK